MEVKKKKKKNSTELQKAKIQGGLNSMIYKKKEKNSLKSILIHICHTPPDVSFSRNLSHHTHSACSTHHRGGWRRPGPGPCAAWGGSGRPGGRPWQAWGRSWPAGAASSDTVGAAPAGEASRSGAFWPPLGPHHARIPPSLSEQIARQGLWCSH